MKNITFAQYEKQLMKDKAFREVAAKLEPEFQLARSLIAARIKKNLTQAQLARKAKTDQASISRLEGASARPSFAFLSKVADALGAKLTVRFDL